MAQAAAETQISSLQLSFTASVNVIRRAVPSFQDISPQQLNTSFGAAPERVAQ
jgi:hypothetical protein